MTFIILIFVAIILYAIYEIVKRRNIPAIKVWGEYVNGESIIKLSNLDPNLPMYNVEVKVFAAKRIPILGIFRDKKILYRGVIDCVGPREEKILYKLLLNGKYDNVYVDITFDDKTMLRHKLRFRFERELKIFTRIK